MRTPAFQAVCTGPTGTNASQSASINYATGSANDSTTAIILGCWATGVSSGTLDVKFSVVTPLSDGQFSVYIGSPWSANMATRLTLSTCRSRIKADALTIGHYAFSPVRATGKISAGPPVHVFVGTAITLMAKPEGPMIALAI